MNVPAKLRSQIVWWVVCAILFGASLAFALR